MKEVKDLIAILKDRGLTVALAESVTCGLASCSMDSSTGTSEIFKGGIICYNPEVKEKLLKVKKSLIEQYSAESPKVTEAMVDGLTKLIDADICAAITGLATSGGSETPEKPVGTIFVSASLKGRSITRRKVFSGTPQKIKSDAVGFLAKTIQELVTHVSPDA